MSSPATVTFASKLHPRLDENNKNSFFSPFSIQLALGMCAAGAKGKTQKCLSSFLGSPLAKEKQDLFFKSLVSEVNDGKERPYELKTANALWGQKGLAYTSDFVEIIEECYDGKFEEVDYKKPKDCVKVINSWCDKNTNGKIPTIISENFINADTLLILTNAIYFKGKWQNQFNKKNTTDDYFKSYGEAKKVRMMHLTEKFFYYENEEFQALDLPYVGENLSMMVLLPRGDNTDYVDNNLVSCYEQATSGFENLKVVVSLPKFKVETKYTLGNTFKDLGAGLAFSDGADFSGITEAARLKISEVIHKAFVECDEEGTEAAAVTAVGMMRCTSMLPVAHPKVFNANKPFVFFIRNRQTGNVLFCGRVVKP